MTTLTSKAPPSTAVPGTAATRAPGRHGPPNRATRVAVALAMCSLPLLRPGGPGNTGPVDVGLLLAIVAAALWASGACARLRLPFVVPVGLFVAAGALAIVTAGAGGTSALALVQDVFLLLWCGALATVGRDPAVLRTAVRAWALSSVAWALLLVVAVLAHLDTLAGITARTGSRAAFTFGDPNLAASYFVTSLFVLRAARYPRRRGLRWAACLALLAAVVLTGSNGGGIALIVGTTIGWILRVRRRRGATAALAGGVALVLGAAVVVATVNISALERSAARSNISLVKDSIGRSAESTGSRTTLASESLALWARGPLLGIGPGMTEPTLAKDQATYVKMAHDDYAAALIERGVAGGAALLLLVWTIGARTTRVVIGPLRPGFAAVVPRPELLAAAVVALLLSGFFYQVLHFRHLWALLGIVAALDLWGRRR